MNLYAVIGSGVGTADAASLGVRLSAWHDAMVAHERRLRSGQSSDRCDEECPHVDARALWAEALATFGERAHDLAFLRARGSQAPRKPHSGKAGRRVTATSDGVRIAAEA